MMFRLAVRTAALAYVGLGLGLSSYVKKNDISPLSCQVDLTSDTAVGHVVVVIHLLGGNSRLCSRTYFG